MEFDKNELRRLIQAHLDETLSDEEFEVLEKQLTGSSEAREEYVTLTRLDSGLRDTPLIESEVEERNEVKSGHKALLWWAVPAMIMMGVSGWYLNGQGSPTERPFSAPESSSIAVISAQADAVWKDADYLPGTPLEPGRIVLKSGLAQIDFYGGAAVSLSGPAELDLIDRDAAVLHRGKLKANVPPAARGFEIRTREFLLEDLGTSFGLSVDDESGSELVVFDGEVRATGGSGPPVLLTEGDSVRLLKGKTITQGNHVAESHAYPEISDVVAGSGSRSRSRYSAWKEDSLLRRQDSRLIAYYDFENLDPATRRLKNRAFHGEGAELDGGIVGARVTAGRWEQKTALDFRSEGDRVRFDIPGEWSELTLFAWVRIDALDRYLNSLFLTDHFDENEIHWQLSNTGHMHFATSPMGAVDINKHNRRFYSETFWDPSRSGQWFLLVATAKKGIGEVRQYVNGRRIAIPDGTQRHKAIDTMKIGESDLGNWSDPLTNGGIRTLNGRIDEFGIYSVALSADEISAMYGVGKP